jgi:hypothetical protein
MGSSCLCVFMYAFRFGAVGFMFIKYLHLLFLTYVLHFCRACWICFWNRAVGFLFKRVIWFCCMNAIIFCSNTSLLIVTMALFLSALAIVKFFL